jgi:hypothetical protein
MIYTIVGFSLIGQFEFNKNNLRNGKVWVRGGEAWATDGSRRR